MVHLRALVPLAALALLASGCGRSEEEAEPAFRHVILISLDTLRADYLGCYGNAEVRTPAIDALAREGIRFEQMSAAAPSTLASHVSLFSGLHPHHHGIARNGWTLNPALVTLPRILQDGGFRTVGVIGALVLHSSTYFDRGFDDYDEVFDDSLRYGSKKTHQRRAEAVTDAAIARLSMSESARSGQRLFLFVHYFDAHHPYDPPPPWDSLYGDPQGAIGEAGAEDLERAVRAHHADILDQAVGQEAVLRAGLRPKLLRGCDGRPLGIDPHLAARYAGEVSYLDHHLGRLVEHLKVEGIWDDALVILTSDHGETFWEHGDFWNHGLCVYDTTVRVPLILRLPGAARAGSVIEQSLSHIDVLPTLLELLDLPAPYRLAGRSFAPLIEGRGLSEQPVFCGATQPWGQEAKGQRWRGMRKSRSVRLGRHKLIHTPYLELEELYDLGADPGERRDLLLEPEEPAAEVAGRLREMLRGWAEGAAPLRSGFGLEQEGGAGLGGDELERLRSALEALGYAGEDGPAEGGR